MATPAPGSSRPHHDALDSIDGEGDYHGHPLKLGDLIVLHDSAKNALAFATTSRYGIRRGSSIRALQCYARDSSPSMHHMNLSHSFTGTQCQYITEHSATVTVTTAMHASCDARGRLPRTVNLEHQSTCDALLP